LAGVRSDTGALRRAINKEEEESGTVL